MATIAPSRRQTGALAEEPLVADDSADRAELVLTTEREANAAVVGVAGELDAYSAPSLEELAAGLRADGCANLTLDLSQTTFVDSSGLRVLLALHNETTAGSGRLVIQNPSDPVARLLSITGLTDHFQKA
jgi:anti-sigma B factor antagonist